jgi:hypothetical protein
MKRGCLSLILAAVLFFDYVSIVHAQPSTTMLLLTPNGLMTLDIDTGNLERQTNEFNNLPRGQGAFSPEGHYLLYWDSALLLTNGIWLKQPTSTSTDLNLPITSKFQLENIYVQWPLGERFVLIQGRMKVESTPSA